jgi:hypothetical protein
MKSEEKSSGFIFQMFHKINLNLENIFFIPYSVKSKRLP